MNPLVDHGVVALLLALSLGSAFMKLGPRSVRRKIQAAAARGLAAAPGMFKLSGLAQRLAGAALQQSQGACGGCESCDTAASARSPDQAAEFSVPLAKIGRRSER